MPEYPRWDKGSSSTRRLGLFVVLFGLFLVVQIPFSVRAVQSAVGDVLLPMILGGADQSAATPAVTPEVTPPPSDVEEWLIDQWKYSIIASPIGFASLLEFRGDGTFTRIAIAITEGPYSTSYYAKTFEGKYSVSGDTLLRSVI